MTTNPTVASALSLFAALSTVLPASESSAPDPAPGGLPRRADWGFALRRPTGGGAEVMRLRPGPAARAGLRDGDRVVRLAGVAPLDERTIVRVEREHAAGDRVRIDLDRGGSAHAIRFTLAALPLERVPGCDVEYGTVATPSGRVRTIVTRPSGAHGRLRTLVFVPWLSDDPIENPVGSPDGWLQLLHGLARRGWQVVRIEKPGVGDSEGRPCGENDLETDLAAFRAGIREVRARDDVDPARLVLFGGSIGADLAPLLADDARPAALVLSGGFARGWREHMVDFERRRLALSGASADSIERALPGFADFYALFLGDGLTPAEVLARRPDLKSLWYDAGDGQFGRPAAYYHQVAALRPDEIFARIDRPTLILFGEYDWIMSRADHERMTGIVNARHPGLATLEVLPRTGHDLVQFTSLEASFHGRDPRFDPVLVERVAAWLEEHVR